MFLKDLNIVNEIKCTCNSCNGTGIYKNKRRKLESLCDYCFGKGYIELKANEKIILIKDEENNVVYEIENGVIIGSLELFEKLRDRNVLRKTK